MMIIDSINDAHLFRPLFKTLDSWRAWLVVLKAIFALPEDYRTAVVLSDIEDFRYAEIAQMLGIPEGTVKSRLFRGRRLLQRKLRGYAEDMGYLKPTLACAG